MTLKPDYEIPAEAAVRHEKYCISWIDDFIFRVDVLERAFIELEDIQQIQIHKQHLTQGAPYCVLFVCPKFGNLSREAREFLARPEANRGALGKAVITPNLGIRMLYDFFMAMNKPPVPHKAFTELADAMTWMKEQRAKKNNRV